MKYKTLHDSEHLYFLSSCIVNHKIIFTDKELAMLILESLSWFRKNGFYKLYAFCLMPNHLHFLIKLLKKDTVIEEIAGNFHKFTGHKIIEILKRNRDSRLLKYFAEHAKRKNDRNYLIWDDTVARNIFDEEVLKETVEYIHNNPRNKSWNLVCDRADYPYSSACFYDRGVMPLIEIDDVREILV